MARIFYSLMIYLILIELAYRILKKISKYFENSRKLAKLGEKSSKVGTQIQARRIGLSMARGAQDSTKKPN